MGMAIGAAGGHVATALLDRELDREPGGGGLEGGDVQVRVNDLVIGRGRECRRR